MPESPASNRPARPTALVLVYILSIFASAFLLFVIQPLVARMILPRYGGTPAVWNTSVVFFQTVLLFGYAYAHLTLRLLGLRRQLLLHAIVLAVSLVALPPSLAALPPPGNSAWPVTEILVVLSLIVAVPFFALSTNSSLVQRWFSVSGLKGGDEPYRLYAASNVGSLLALLAYPVLVEPLWGIGFQSRLWAAGYIVWLALTGAVMVVVWRALRGAVTEDAGQRQAGDDGALAAVSWRRRGLWTARAAVAASLLLSATMLITTDVAPVPLLWVIPLGVYLITFIIAFGTSRPLPRRPFVACALACATLSLSVLLIGVPFPLWLEMALPLATLFFGAMVCHGDIAADRPAPIHLTEFYLWISIGGVVGGVLNSIVAPQLFSSVAEYPLTLAALAAVTLLPAGARQATGSRRQPDVAAWLLVAIMVAVTLWAAVSARQGTTGQRVLVVLTPQLVLLGGVFALLTRRAWPFVVATALAAAFLIGGFHLPEDLIVQERSFFAVQRVLQARGGRVLKHGSTVHGIQMDDPALRQTPGAYFHPNGPLGSLMVDAPGDASIAVIGLGAGSLAALSKPDQSLTYYEIDPLVQRIAEDYFTYLEDARAPVEVVLGDGRLTLEAAGDETYDLLLVDAFSSDSIPTHLLTTEALRMYQEKITADGLIAVQISNRYLDLGRVVSGLAREAGLDAAVYRYVPSEADRLQGASPSVVAAVSPSTDVIEALVSGGRWQRFDEDADGVVWTDDYAPLLGIVRWQ